MNNVVINEQSQEEHVGGNYQTGDLAGLLDLAMGAHNRRSEQEASEALDKQAQEYRERDHERQEKKQASDQARHDQRERAADRARAGGSGLAMSGSLLLGSAARTAQDRAEESAAHEQEDRPTLDSSKKAKTGKRTAPRASLLAQGAATYGNRRIS